MQDTCDTTFEEWTPARGACRALCGGTLAALLCALFADIAAWHFPYACLHWMLRGACAFGVAWVLFRVVHRAAGMTSWFCTTLAVALAILVMLSQHVVFALHGVWTVHGVVAGWSWCDPATILACNMTALAGIGLCAAQYHEGGADGGVLCDFLNSRIRG